MKLLVVLCLLIASTVIAQPVSRTSFNGNWQFRLDADSNWHDLQLPHDWSIEGKFDKNNPATVGGGALPGGIGWYKKIFTLPASSKDLQTFIEFDGIYCNSEAWINGQYLGKRANGYISFQYDLTRFLLCAPAENQLLIKVNNSMQPNSRWYSGSGIYRNVWLTQVQPLHIDHWGTVVRTMGGMGDSAHLYVETTIKNESKSDKEILLVSTIYDGSGSAVATTSKKINTVRTASVHSNQALAIAAPHYWSLDDPYLYRLESKLVDDGKVIDTYNTTTGIRYFHFDADKGFFLNGKSVKIRGVCNHHDLGALGSAINTRALQRQLELLKAMGCNGIRTSHNPPAPELLDLCDRMGFIVMDEAFDMWRRSKNKYDYHLNWDEDHYRDLVAQLQRDRNHPSVFIWSVGNEIGEQWGDTSARAMARELVSIVRNWDPTRPVVTANNETGKNNQLLLSGAFDLVGYNYHQNDWTTVQQRWPGKSMIVTESVSALATRGHYDKVSADTIRRWPVRWDLPFTTGNADFTVSAYDHVSTPWGSTHEESLRVLENNPQVSGMFIWTGFDYLGEPTPYEWPARSSYFGIMDLAGFPKDVYYLYQSAWTNKPVLHLLPHWNWNRGDTIDVVAYYNNADEVELFLGGRSLGTRTKTNGSMHVKWSVPFRAGTLRAISRMNGKTVLTTEIKTAGKADHIELRADRNNINADGSDLCFITASVVDKNGTVVPGASQVIHYETNDVGEIVGVDSGDPTSHESFKAKQHSVLNGLGLVIVRSRLQKGKIMVQATADGLKAGRIEINSGQ